MPLRHGRKLYYDPVLGRFLTRDPAGYPDGPNNYLYCNNNPINHIDPLGLLIETVWDVGNIVAGVASAALNAYAGNWSGAAVDAVGVAIDTAAAVLPGVPGGAATLIKAKRLEKVADAALEAGEQAVKHGEGALTAGAKLMRGEATEQASKEFFQEGADQLAKEGAQKAVQETTETAADAIRKGAEAGGAPGKPVPNPAGQHGKLDHRTTVSELVDEAAGDFPGDIVHEGTSIKSKTGINRRPDVWVEDQVTGDVKKVYEAARANKGGSFVSREVKKMQEYNKAGIPNRFKEVK